jgi:hypothetical protein
MRDVMKLIATCIIWGMITIILTVSRFEIGGDMIWLALIMGVAATISTGFIWQHSGQREEKELQERAGKLKRTNRVSRLVEGLDEDELMDMEDFLAARREDRLSNGR